MFNNAIYNSTTNVHLFFGAINTFRQRSIYKIAAPYDFTNWPFCGKILTWKERFEESSDISMYNDY